MLDKIVVLRETFRAFEGMSSNEASEGGGLITVDGWTVIRNHFYVSVCDRRPMTTALRSCLRQADAL